MTTALSSDIGWFLDHGDDRYRIRAATESEQQQTPGATVTLVERLRERLPDGGFQYRYIRLVVKPDLAAKVIAAGPRCLGEMHFLPGGAKVQVILDGKPVVLQ